MRALLLAAAAALTGCADSTGASRQALGGCSSDDDCGQQICVERMCLTACRLDHVEDCERGFCSTRGDDTAVCWGSLATGDDGEDRLLAVGDEVDGAVGGADADLIPLVLTETRRYFLTVAAGGPVAVELYDQAGVLSYNQTTSYHLIELITWYAGKTYPVVIRAAGGGSADYTVTFTPTD